MLLRGKGIADGCERYRRALQGTHVISYGLTAGRAIAEGLTLDNLRASAFAGNVPIHFVGLPKLMNQLVDHTRAQIGTHFGQLSGSRIWRGIRDRL